MRSLYFAVKVRRFGVVVSSAGGALGAATTRAGGIVGEISDPASGESGVFEGITIGSVSFALKCKHQPVECLTLIGTEGYAKGKKSLFLAEMGTGSGKTACGISLSRYLFDLHKKEVAAWVPCRERKGVRLAVVITHSTAVRDEWVREVERFATLDPAARMAVINPMGSGWTDVNSPMAFPENGTIIVASPQTLGTPENRHALDLMIHKVDGEVAVIIDEVHHYADSNSWGAFVSASTASARITCGLSGTPYRHDDGAILGVNTGDRSELVTDYRYTKARAISDGVVAMLRFQTVDCVFEDTEQSSGRILTSKYMSSAKNDEADNFLREALRPGAATLDACLQTAVVELEKIRANSLLLPRPAGAIQCATKSQLHYIQAFLTALGYRVLSTFSGDGQKVSDIITRFRDGEGDWILGVKRLTEGLNIPRLRIGLQVNYNLTTRQAFEQFCGRLERLIIGFDHSLQIGVMIIPNFWKFRQYAAQYECDVKDVELSRNAAVYDCPGCGNQLPRAVAFCPYCEMTNVRERIIAARMGSDGHVVPSMVLQRAFISDLIHNGQTMQPDEVPALARAYDHRCISLGVPATVKLSSEDKAFRELRYQRLGNFGLRSP